MTRVPVNEKIVIKEPTNIKDIGLKELVRSGVNHKDIVPNTFLMTSLFLYFGFILCFGPLFPVGISLIGLGAVIAASIAIFCYKIEQKHQAYTSQYKEWTDYENFLGIKDVNTGQHQADLNQQKSNDTVLVNVVNDLVKHLEKEVKFSSSHWLVSVITNSKEKFKQNLLAELKDEFAFGYGVLVKEDVLPKLKGAFDKALKGKEPMITEAVTKEALKLFKEEMKSVGSHPNADRQANYTNIPGLTDPLREVGRGNSQVEQNQPRQRDTANRAIGI